MALEAVGLRALRPEDHEAIFEIARALASWFAIIDQMALAADLASHEGLLAEQAHQPLGFLLYTEIRPQVVRLSWMGVTPAKQQQGIGSRLLAALEQVLHARQIRALETRILAPTLAPHFTPVHRFYLHHGFEVVRREPDAFGPGRDALLLVKRLRRP